MKNTDELLMRLLARVGLRGVLTRLIEMCGAEAVRAEMASLMGTPAVSGLAYTPSAPLPV